MYQQNLSVQEGKTSGLISNFKVTHYESNFKRKKKEKKRKTLSEHIIKRNKLVCVPVKVRHSLHTTYRKKKKKTVFAVLFFLHPKVHFGQTVVPH